MHAMMSSSGHRQALAAGLGLVKHVKVAIEQVTPTLHRPDQVPDRLMPLL